MNRETYIRAVLECNFAGFKDEIIDIAVRRIMEYEPTKHGRWVENEYGYCNCSECNMKGYIFYRYCPNCGAKMDEVEG